MTGNKIQKTNEILNTEKAFGECTENLDKKSCKKKHLTECEFYHERNKTCLINYLLKTNGFDADTDSVYCKGSPNCHYKQLQQAKAELKKIKDDLLKDKLNLREFLICESLIKEHERELQAKDKKIEELKIKIKYLNGIKFDENGNCFKNGGYCDPEDCKADLSCQNKEVYTLKAENKTMREALDTILTNIKIAKQGGIQLKDTILSIEYSVKQALEECGERK